MNCINCEHDGTYQGIPAHWCEYFSPGELNMNYPNTMDGCPYHEIRDGKHDISEFWQTDELSEMREHEDRQV